MKVLFVILIVGFVHTSLAADISFVVYFTKGKISKSSSKTVLKKGDQLYLQETLSIGEQSSVILICSNYKIIQLGKKGNYTVKSLMNQCEKNPIAYTNSYFKYVWNELTHPHGQPEQNPEEYMKNVGAVSRGCNEVATGISIDTLNYSGGFLPVYWATSYQNTYATVYNQLFDGAILVKMPVEKGQPVQLNNLCKELPAGEYYWQLTDKEGSTNCERNFLKIWEEISCKKELNELLKTVPATSPGETAFARAFLMEENHFMAEAFKYYQQAVQLNPKNNVFKKSLQKFYETNF